MTEQRRSLGQQGEDLAVDLLKKEGYKILQRNYRTRFGEIDIIAEDRGVICFVEVRTRRSSQFGTPVESVSKTKQRKLTQMATYFLKNHAYQDKPARFDVVAVGCEQQAQPTLHIVKDAFDNSDQ